MKSLRLFRSLILALVALLGVGLHNSASAASAAEIDRDARNALQTLLQTHPAAQAINRQAKAVLIFPRIIKAGFIFGGGYGEGELLRGNRVAGYYNSVSGSWGLQAGAQSYGYAVFLMSDRAVNYLRDSRGWEIGVGPTVVMVDDGVAKNLSSSTLQSDAYAFIFNQQGLMAGVTIEGSKISPLIR
jgi:lipid-binding SYLF domain-containing protein